MDQKLPLVSSGETVSFRPEIRGVAYGHASVHGASAGDIYDQAMLQRHETDFYSQAAMLPLELRQGVLSAHEELSSRNDYKGVRNLEYNVSSYLELSDMEKSLARKEKEIVKAFGRTLPVDSDLREGAENEYIGTQEYRECFKRAIESDPFLRSKIEMVGRELGTDVLGMIGTSEILYDNLRSFPGSPLSKRELVRELAKEGMVLQAGEYPVRHKRGIGDYVPVDRGEKEHIGRRRIFAVGVAALSLGAVGAAVHGQAVHNDAGYHFKNAARDIGNWFFVGGTDRNGNVQPNASGYQQWSDSDVLNNSDPDHDGLNNSCESRYGTDPLLADTDGDGMGDGFEVYAQEMWKNTNTSYRPYDPLRRNERYAIIVQNQVFPDTGFPGILVEKYRFKPDNVRLLKQNETSLSDFKNILENASQKMGDEGFLFLGFNQHGSGQGVTFKDTGITYEELDSLLGKVKSPVVAVFDQCYSGAAANKMSNPVIYTPSNETEVSLAGQIHTKFWMVFGSNWSLNVGSEHLRYPEAADRKFGNGDGHVSFKEAFDLGKWDWLNYSYPLGQKHPLEKDLKGLGKYLFPGDCTIE